MTLREQLLALRERKAGRYTTEEAWAMDAELWGLIPALVAALEGKP